VPILLVDFMAESMFYLIVVVALIVYICKKVAASNSEVASALKGAATKKALGLIGKFLK
jgi:uncharacterized membrane protein